MSHVLADNLYERLGVPRTATPAHIRQAYHRLLRQHPPERAPEEFKRIREAYETLSDPHSREEYDRAPSPAVQGWLAIAGAAMKDEDYGTAERYLKQVLLEAPDLDYVRNWLGLCLLYQDRGTEAMTQYQRLLRLPGATASWFGNAGHACRQARRFEEAERMFRRAIVLEEDDASQYFVGLADLHIEQKAYAQAQAVLEQAIRHDGHVNFEDLQYFTKLLEVSLFQEDLPRSNEVLNRIQHVVADEEQARYVAWKLGMLCQQLIRGAKFQFAIAFSKAARRLQPRDHDYAALERFASLLEQRDIKSALQTLESDPSFAQAGWLYNLRRDIEPHLSEGNEASGKRSRERGHEILVRLGMIVGVIWLLNYCDGSSRAGPGNNMLMTDAAPAEMDGVPANTPDGGNSPGLTFDTMPRVDPPGVAESMDTTAIGTVISLRTGTEIVPKRGAGYGDLTVRNGTIDDAVVRLVNVLTGRTHRAVYIRGGEDYKINGIPKGTYRVQFAMGLDWDAHARRFLIGPKYSEFERPTTFEEIEEEDGILYSSQQVTLHPVEGGTAKTRQVNPEEFILESS